MAWAAGGAAALALAPVYALPLLFVALPVLVWSTDGAAPAEHGPWARARGGFVVGWWFGFGFFLVGLHWVGAALLVEPDRFAWALPLAVAGLPAGLALFAGAGLAVAALAWSPGYVRIIALALGWTALEWLRGLVFTGFPWNLIGQAAVGSDALMQTAAVTGDLGLSLILVAAAAAPATLADPGPAWRRFAPTAAGLLVLAALHAAGAHRLARAAQADVPGVALRIVQPNISQSEKWDAGFRAETVARYLDMTHNGNDGAPMGAAPTLVIWPETALPLLMLRDAGLMARIAAALPQGARLISGALRARPAGTDWSYFNSVVVVGGDGRLEGGYDKRRLVPFGEFLPFQGWLESLGLHQLTGLIGGFTAGTGPGRLSAGAAPPFAPLVCYEVIFSGHLHDGAPRPGWLVNVTNDAWYGNGFGPRQHFAQARLRAVEEGLPLARAANTGISAVIDAYGRVRAGLDYGVRGVIDAPLPASLPVTFYAAHGRAPLAAAMAVMAGFVVWRRRGRKQPFTTSR